MTLQFPLPLGRGNFSEIIDAISVWVWYNIEKQKGVV